jgi:alkylation response protein AidB-like acyl-CoA dehydrogenase
MKVLDCGRLHIGAVCVGVAERLIEDSLRCAMERKQFGEPIAQFQLVQAMLADSRAEAYAARCMVEETARRKEAGRDVAEAACCKMYASEMVGRVADGPCRSTAGPATSRSTAWSASTATSACSASTRARPRSSSSSSRAT